MSQDRVMLLIDADNLSLDVTEQAIRLLLNQHGGLHVRRAYCTAESAVANQSAFKRLGIKPMVNLATGKNSTDIALAVDAIDLVLSERPDVVVIASSDSDFAPLVQRLREKGCVVRGIGQKGKVGDETQDVYDDYTVIEHRGGSASRAAGRSATPSSRAPRPSRARAARPEQADRAAPAHMPERAETAVAPAAAAQTPSPRGRGRGRGLGGAVRSRNEEEAIAPAAHREPAGAERETVQPTQAAAVGVQASGSLVGRPAEPDLVRAGVQAETAPADATEETAEALEAASDVAALRAASEAAQQGAIETLPAQKRRASKKTVGTAADRVVAQRAPRARKTTASSAAAVSLPQRPLVAAAELPSVAEAAPSTSPVQEPDPEVVVASARRRARTPKAGTVRAASSAPVAANAAPVAEAAPALFDEPSASTARNGRKAAAQPEPVPAAPAASAPTSATRATLQAVLQCLPELTRGQSLALNVAVQRLREARLLGKNTSSLKLFAQFADNLDLLPARNPSQVKLRV
jgi:uncharacterized protein (TIGR00288 family)